MAPLIESSAASAKSNQTTFSSGPSEDAIVGGSITIALAGTTGLDAARVDLGDGSSWTELTNLTSNDSWLFTWDSSSVTDGDYQLRVEGFDSQGTTGITEGSNFTVDNTAPTGLTFVLPTPDYGTGTSVGSRAWYATPADGTLTFTWGAADASLGHAALTDVPGPGTPSNDGPGFLAYRWDWTTGSFPSQGKWSPKLTVYDSAGNSDSETRYIGIDTVGPTVGTPTLSISSGWTNAGVLLFSNLFNGATDAGGSGIAGYEVRDSADSTWNSVGLGGSGSISLQEGVRIIQFRAIDNVGNAGDPIERTVNVDATAPVAGGWFVPELTTSTTGGVDVSVEATDAFSGISLTASKIQYGFDSDGIGETPDVTGSWIDVGNGLEVTLASTIDWSTKEGQYLSLRAVMVDNATNSGNSPTQHFAILPYLDLSWESATVDRLVVRAGSSGIVNITSTLTSNQPYAGVVTVKLETAPADRSSDYGWTAIETRTLPATALYDSREVIIWSMTIYNEGEYDVRVTVDPNDAISERDDGNNAAYMVVQGASQRMVGAVTSFAPSLVMVLLAGAYWQWIQRRDSHSSE